MTDMIIWMLVLLAPHAEPQMLGGFMSEDTCEEAMAQIETETKGMHAITVCSAYVPRDKA